MSNIIERLIPLFAFIMVIGVIGIIVTHSPVFVWVFGSGIGGMLLAMVVLID